MECLFRVRYKATKRIVKVYKVKFSNGPMSFIEFLVYVDKKWKFESAKLFEPIEKGGAE